MSMQASYGSMWKDFIPVQQELFQTNFFSQIICAFMV